MLLEYLAKANGGLVLEFGVAGGESIRRLARVGREVWGFDGFRGLPHDWGGDCRGKFSCPKPSVPENVHLVEGLFSDTLEPFLLAHPGPVAFVHMDCDLYTSCIYILRCLRERFVPGSVIAFDEIDQFAAGDWGEREAWTRYRGESGQPWGYAGKQHQWGQVWVYAPHN